MSSPNLDPQVDATLLPEPFEVNTEVVDKATAAARAALEWMSSRFGSPARRSAPAPAPAPKSPRVEPAERDATLPST